MTAGAHYTQSRQNSLQEESGDSVFPRNFNAPLQMTSKSCAKEAVSACILEIGVAVEDFQARKRQDLSFKRGDKILIEQKTSGSEWVYGSIGQKKGWFPLNAVRLEQH